MEWLLFLLVACCIAMIFFMRGGHGKSGDK